MERTFRRQRLLLSLALVALVGLSWWYLWLGAGTGMSAEAMSAAVLFPHRAPELPGDMGSAWPIVVAMWWVMMVAMMTPGALPLVLLYRRVIDHHARHGPRKFFFSGALLLGYLAVWLAFSVVVATLQLLLQPTGLLSGMMWWSRSAVFSAALLCAAGLYQFSTWKQACLTQCREPARFLASHAQYGLAAAFRLGILHGGYCVGCCWLLMALLFVGGVMNLFWIVALSLLVLCEKLLPGGRMVAHATGGVLIAWAVATLLV